MRYKNRFEPQERLTSKAGCAASSGQ
jgi:hypothetical protein